MTQRMQLADNFDRLVPVLAAALCVAAIFVSYPGHVSMDTSIQLHEAQVGHTITWAPRFMSALLRAFGGGELACALFITLNAILAYSAFAVAWASGRVTSDRKPAKIARWKAFLIKASALILIMNPLIFLFVGIVWKDVLFASLLSFAASFMLYGASRGEARIWYWLLPVAAVHAAMFTRQHGIFLGIFMIPACVILYARAGVSQRVGRAIRFTICYAVFAIFFQIALNILMPLGNDPNMSSVGVRNLQAYDLAGMVVEGLPSAELPNGMAQPEFAEGAQLAYSPERIDVLFNDDRVNLAYATVSNDEMKDAWLSSIFRHPLIYAEMKGKQVAWLISLERLDKCLPIHLGVEGNPEFLKSLGIQRGVDRFDGDLLKASFMARHTFLHRHWAFLLILLACVLVVVIKRRQLGGAMVIALGGGLMGCVAFYGSFFITTIACDFRYLFPGMLLTSVLSIGLLSRSREWM